MLLSQADLRSLSTEEKYELLRRQWTRGDVAVEGAPAGRRGYVTIAHADGSVEQRHYTQAHTAVYATGSLNLIPNTVSIGGVPLREQVFTVQVQAPEKPHVRRSHRERLESMTARLVTSWRAGVLDEPMLAQIAGEYWRRGTPITVEALRQVAERSLRQAEQDLKDRDAKRATRKWRG